MLISIRKNDIDNIYYVKIKNIPFALPFMGPKGYNI